MAGNEYLYNIPQVEIVLSVAVISVSVDQTYGILGGAQCEQPPDQDDAEYQYAEPKPKLIDLACRVVMAYVVLCACCVGCVVNGFTYFLAFFFSFF